MVIGVLGPLTAGLVAGWLLLCPVSTLSDRVLGSLGVVSDLVRSSVALNAAAVVRGSLGRFVSLACCRWGGGVGSHCLGGCCSLQRSTVCRQASLSRPPPLPVGMLSSRIAVSPFTGSVLSASPLGRRWFDRGLFGFEDVDVGCRRLAAAGLGFFGSRLLAWRRQQTRDVEAFFGVASVTCHRAHAPFSRPPQRKKSPRSSRRHYRP